MFDERYGKASINLENNFGTQLHEEAEGQSEIIQLQNYANALLSQGQQLIDIGDEGFSGIINNKKQSVSSAFGNCTLISGISKISKSGFIDHLDGRTFWPTHQTPLNRKNEMTDIFIRRFFEKAGLSINSFPLQELGYTPYTFNPELSLDLNLRAVLQDVSKAEFINISEPEIKWLISLYSSSSNNRDLRLFNFFEYLDSAYTEMNDLEKVEFFNKLKNSVFYKHFFKKFKDYFPSEVETSLISNIREMGEDTVIYIGESFSWLDNPDDNLANIYNTDQYITTIQGICGVAKLTGATVSIFPPKDSTYSERDISGTSFKNRAWRLVPNIDGEYHLICEQFQGVNYNPISPIGENNKLINLKPKELDLNLDIEQQLEDFGFIRPEFRSTY
jgi:hypothetical protein